MLLVLQSVLSSRHDQLMSGFNELELAHQAHAAHAREAFEQLAQEAAALEHRQAQYEALQAGLTSVMHCMTGRGCAFQARKEAKLPEPQSAVFSMRS
jgi:hypothetical protein